MRSLRTVQRERDSDYDLRQETGQFAFCLEQGFPRFCTSGVVGALSAGRGYRVMAYDSPRKLS